MESTKLAVLALALLVTTGCAIRKPVNVVFVRPVKQVAKGMYCDTKDSEGKCLHWAKHPYPCVYNDQTGDCTAETR